MEQSQFRDEIMKAMNDLAASIQAMKQEAEKAGGISPETKELVARLTGRIDQLEALMKRPGPYGEERPVIADTVSAIVANSEEFKAWNARGWHKGGFAVEVKGLMDMIRKTTITTTAVGNSTPGILNPQRVPGIVGPGLRTFVLRDLIPFYPTANNAVDFVKENALTSNASSQTEASDKQESALTFTIDSATVTTIAHWIPATRQVLDDFTQLQQYIESRLMWGLKNKEDEQLLKGDGLGAHISGLITEATAYNTSYNVASDTYIDKLRHAKKQVRLSEFEADGVVLNPADWEAIELIKTEEGGANKGQYIMGGPAGTAEPRIWGMPVVLTTQMTAGKFLVANFGLACAGYEREAARIDVSTEHSDYFVKNMVAIRAEMRVTLAVFRPLALIYGSL